MVDSKDFNSQEPQTQSAFAHVCAAGHAKPVLFDGDFNSQNLAQGLMKDFNSQDLPTHSAFAHDCAAGHAKP
eukprot:6664789-Karenia_brevis.AAC.1